MSEETTESAPNPNATIVGILAAKAERHARRVERIFGEPSERPLDHDRVVGQPPTSEENTDG
jgi:hypothetical protein